MRFAKGLAIVLAVGVLAADPVVARSARVDEIRTEYRSILGLVAKGDRTLAAEELVAFEISVVGDKQAWRYIDTIWRTKLGVIRELLEAQPVDLLRPVILLHHDAYFEYAEMNRRYLAGHSRQMAAELAEIYVERTDSNEAAFFSGWVLTSLGTYLWTPSSVGDSADLFYRAFLADPGNETALLGLAVAYEKKGDYGRAIEYLSQAVSLAPGNKEARLRLVLCQVRSEFEPTPNQLARLRSLTESGSPDWIRSIAYQELARVLSHGGDLEAAESTLRAGLQVLAGDQNLSLQLAAILERRGRRGEALDIVEAISPGTGPVSSARERYDFWVPEGVEEARVEYLGEEERSLVALSASLSSPPKEGK